MRVIDCSKSGVKYEVEKHPVAFSAQTMAATTHESGKFIAKPVLVKADGKYLLCVLAASSKIDLAALKRQLSAKSVELANEDDIGKLFPDCELRYQGKKHFGNLSICPPLWISPSKRTTTYCFRQALTKSQSE